VKTFTVGDLKAHFSEVLSEVRAGHEIGIAFGRKKEAVAVIVPFAHYSQKKRRLGLLERRAKFKFARFPFSDDELLKS
jgi:antitoxin (DNA-binding transcriptional repressor) of toxin-antitoxin stability system